MEKAPVVPLSRRRERRVLTCCGTRDRQDPQKGVARLVQRRHPHLHGQLLVPLVVLALVYELVRPFGGVVAPHFRLVPRVVIWPVNLAPATLGRLSLATCSAAWEPSARMHFPLTSYPRAQGRASRSLNTPEPLDTTRDADPSHPAPHSPPPHSPPSSNEGISTPLRAHPLTSSRSPRGGGSSRTPPRRSLAPCPPPARLALASRRPSSA